MKRKPTMTAAAAIAAAASSVYVNKDAQLKLEDGVDANQRNPVVQLHMIFRSGRTEALTHQNLIDRGPYDVSRRFPRLRNVLFR